MKVFHLHIKSFVPATMDEVWTLAANPQKLVEFTPAYFGLFLKQDSKIEEGGFIHMGLGLEKFPYQMDWLARVEKVQSQGPKRSFIDTQELGPFAFWRHQHLFEEAPGGVLVEDIVEYSLPVASLKKFHSLFNLWVRTTLSSLFRERQNRLADFVQRTARAPQLPNGHA